MKTSRSLLPALLLSALAVPAVAAIRPCATPITLSPPSLTVGTTGLAYGQTLTAAGGTAFTFSTTQGVLPPGLALANATATTVDIAGSPTTPGTFVFTITARHTPNGCSGGQMFALFVNDRTVVTTTPGTTVFVEDGGPVVVDAGVTVSDTDSPNLASATVTITNPQDGAAEVLAATACAGLTVTPGLNTLGISGSQPPAAYQSCLRSVTYDNSSQNRGTTPRVLSFVANDGTASSAAANKTVSVGGTDDPPVANPITPPAFGEDAAAVITLSYTDPDGDQATACAVTVPTNVSVSTPCACSTGVCTVGVTGAPLNYNGPASFSYTVTANAQTSNSALASLTITAIDDPPVANAISPAAFNEDTQSIITLSYSDVESDLATACAVTGPTNVTVSTPCACSGAGVCTVGVTGSPLNYNGPASFSYTVTANAQTSNSATASLTITPVNDPPVASAITPPAFNEDTQSIITLSYSDVEADLATACAVTGPTNVTVSTPCACSGAGVCTVGVTGSPLNYNGPASFSYTVTAAAQTSNSATASLTITAVADPPVADPITPAAFDEDTTASITLSYTDPDGDQATACTVTSPTNVTVSTACACSTGVCTVGVTGTPLNFNGAASFSYTVTANAQTSNSALASLTITAVNDAPVLGSVTGGFTYTENDAATAIAPALTVTDVDSTTLSSATITVSANFQSGQDVLAFTNGAGMGNVAGSFAGNVLTLTSAGSTATTAQWQTALRAVRYANSSDDPNTSVRTVSFQVNDGAPANNLSNQVSRTITVTAVNDAPTANGFTNQPAQAGIPIAYPAGKLGGTDLEAGTTITIDLTPINVTNGTVSLGADGSFTLTPFPAATTASFQYRVSDNGNPAPGLNSAYVTVSFTVAGPAIYFVKSAGAGNCTLGNECTLTQAVTNIGASLNARIFISDANNHGSAVPLNSGGWLVGQGVTGTTFDALFGIGAPAQGTLAPRPSLALPRPTVTNTVTLNANSAVRGLNISSAAATGITDIAAAITGALVSEVGVTTTTATAVNFSNTAGTFSFTGVTTTGGAGVSLTGANSGGTFSFSAVSVSSGANAAFVATGGGTVQVTGATNTLTATTATALNVANTTIGASGLTFRSISSNGGSATGIILDTTGSSGGLTVSGNGSAGTGGTIANKTGSDGATATGVGIYLNNTSNVSLNWMQLQDFQNYAIRGLLVSGFTMTNSNVTVSSFASNGTSAAVDEGSVSFGTRAPGGTTGLTGTASITNTTIRKGFEDSLSIFNSSGSLNLTLDNCTLSDTFSGVNDGNDGFVVQGYNTASITVDVRNSDFSANRGDHFNATADDNANLTVTFGTNGANTLTGGAPGALGQSITIQTGVQWNGTGAVNVSNNSIVNAVDTPINVNVGGPGTFTARIHNNTIGTSGVANSGTVGNKDAVRIVANGDKAVLGANANGGTLTVAVTNNTIQQVSGNGIFIIARDGGSVADPIALNVTVTGNLLREPAPGANGMRAEAGASSTPTPDRANLCIDMGGAGALANTVQGDWGVAIGADEIRIRHQFSATNTFRLPGFVGVSPTDVPAYLTGRNSGFPPATASATVAGGGAYTGGASCPLPPP
jgi:hypothetical protein